MKKITKLFLGVFMLFVMITNVSAVTINVNSTAGTVDTNSRHVTNTSTFTVSGVQSTDTFKAYKVLDAFYNGSTNTFTYEFTSDFASFLADSTTYRTLTVSQYQSLTSGDVTNGSVSSNSTLDTLVSQYASYIKDEAVSGQNMTVSGTNATGTLEAGAWLVLPATTTKVYAVMVGNIEFRPNSNGTDWDITSPTIVAKVSSSNVTKVITSTNSAEATFNRGDEYTYTITATVPTYPTNATNKTLSIKETLSNGVSLKSISSIVVTDGGNALTTRADGTVVDGDGHTVATITKTGNDINIVLDADYVDSNTIGIVYTASLNNDSVLGTAGNITTTTMTYANDPYGNGTTTSTGVVNTVRTYGIDLFKHDGSNNGLQGAVYTIYSDSGLNNSVGTITTGSNGHGTYDGLASGTYYLMETTAPTGYKINSNIITVTINTSNNYTETSQADSVLGFLPSTGGVGTYIFILIGAVLVVGALVFMYKYLNKNKNGK